MKTNILNFASYCYQYTEENTCNHQIKAKLRYKLVSIENTMPNIITIKHIMTDKTNFKLPANNSSQESGTLFKLFTKLYLSFHDHFRFL